MIPFGTYQKFSIQNISKNGKKKVNTSGIQISQN